MSTHKVSEVSAKDLSILCQQGNIEGLRSYLNEKADIEILILNQALHQCLNNFDSKSSHFECICELLQKGANPNSQDENGRTPLMLSCFKGNLQLSKYLIYEKKVDVNIKDINKHNALYYAINNEASIELYEICKNLLMKGCELNCDTTDGFTLLWKAIERKQTKVVQLLCDQGVLINLANNSTGDSPLHLAVALKNKKIIEILIEKYANVSKKNKQNQTPFDLAKDDAELLSFMKNLEKKQKTSEHTAIFNSLDSKNLFDSATKPNVTKQPLKLTNYNLSPSHLSASFREIYKSEQSESNSESLQFELETNSQHQHFLHKNVAKTPPLSQHNPYMQQDSITNHLPSVNACLSPPMNFKSQPNSLMKYNSNNNRNENAYSQNINMGQRYPKKKPQQYINRENNKKTGSFQQPNLYSLPNSNNINNMNMRPNPNPMNMGGLIAPFEQNEQFQQNYTFQNPSFKLDFQNNTNTYNSNSFIAMNNNNDNSNNSNINLKLTPPGIQTMHNYKPNLSATSTYLPNNSNTNSEDPTNDEIEAIEKQNEELKNEILLLESQLSTMNLESNEENTQENLESQSFKHKEVQTEDPQQSFFIEKHGKNSKITMFLPTDSVAQNLHKEMIEFERIVTEIQKDYKQKLLDFLPTFKSMIQDITKIEPDLTLYGSYETELALPYSDIDIFVNLRVGPIDENLIQRICENFKKRKFANIECKRYHHANPLQPQVVLIHKNKYEVSFPHDVFESRLNLIFSDSQKFNGFRYVSLIKTYLSTIKPLRYLILPLKEFIYRSKLSILHKELVKTQRKSTEIDLKDMESPLLGNLLIEFLNYYGFEMDYIFKEILVLLPETFPEEKIPPGQTSLIDRNDANPKLIIADPLKRQINVGRSAIITKIKSAFSLAYIVSHQNYRSNACVCNEGAENKQKRELCCYMLERIFNCFHEIAPHRKNI